jgi:hypothetical protein
MLTAMNHSAAPAGPLVVLAAALIALLLLAVVALVVLRSRAAPPALPPAAPEGARPDARVYRDDLAVFFAHPPGFPGALAPAPPGAPVPLFLPAGATPSVSEGPAGATVARADGPSAAGGVPAVRFLLAMVALALVLIAGAAAAGLLSSGGGNAARATTAPSAAASSRSAEPAVPALAAVPESPAPGESGAGGLAFISLPLGRGDTSARLAFGGLVLERQAVGVTVTYPGIGLSTHGDQSLVHLRLPTFNCLAADAPADPAEAGCVPSVTEFADLPTPALRMSRDGNRLTFSGRVPTYTRPDGTAPVYTGRVYDLTLTVTPGRRLAGNRAVADGALTLGSSTSRRSGDPAVDVLQQGR